MRPLNAIIHTITSKQFALCLGFGILWSLTKGFMNSEVFLFPDKSSEINFTFLFYNGLLSLIAVIFALPAFKKFERVPLWIAALLVSFGLWFLDKSQIAFAVIGSALCAIGMTWLFVRWFTLFTTNSTRPFLDIPVAFLTGNIISWLYVLLDTKGDSMLYVIGIFASTLLAQSFKPLSSESNDLENLAEQQTLRTLATLLKPSATSIISFFAVSTISIAISYIALFQREVSLNDQLWIHLIGPTLGALIALLIHRTFSSRINASQISIFIVATLILFLPLFQSSYVSIFRLASMAVVEILLIQVIALTIKAAKKQLELSRALGSICWCVLSLSTFLGTSIGYICSQLSLNSALFYGSLGTLFGYFLITALVLLLPFSGKGKEEATPEGFTGEFKTPAKTANGLTSEETKRALLDNVAKRYGLTTREKEVLSLLVSGRSGTYIAKEFVVSPETVKGHTRHIYQKLNVHSKQELIDWFQDLEGLKPLE